MKPNVLDYEPHKALFVPDDNPLIFYKKVLEFAGTHLNSKGCIYCEINERFGDEIKDMFRDEKLVAVEVKQDIYGKDRFVKGAK